MFHTKAWHTRFTVGFMPNGWLGVFLLSLPDTKNGFLVCYPIELTSMFEVPRVGYEKLSSDQLWGELGFYSMHLAKAPQYRPKLMLG
jgi:hypothetical protein